MPCHVLNIPRQLTNASHVRVLGNENRPDQRVLGKVHPSDLLNAALDDTAAFAISPAYQKRRAARRGVAHA